jgi:hypothetical protein
LRLPIVGPNYGASVSIDRDAKQVSFASSMLAFNQASESHFICLVHGKVVVQKANPPKMFVGLKLHHD